MDSKNPLPGSVWLAASLMLAGSFFLFALATPSSHQNFAHEAWEIGRFFELWWLWLSLPFCCAFAVVAAIRSDSTTRAAGATIAILSFLYSLFVGYSFWTQW